MSLESDLKKYEKLIEKAKKTGKEANELMENIKTRIKTGKETTGDRIRDFVICSYGWASKDFEDAYNRLDKRLKNKAGKQILAVGEITEEKDLLEKKYMAHSDDEAEEHCLMPPPRHTVTETRLRLGVLLEDCLSFDLEKNKIMFSVGRHAAQFYRDHTHWKLVEEHISFDAHEMALLDEKLNKESKKHDIFSYLRGTSRSERIFVYLCEEVEKYFSEPRLDLSYITALKLLGLEAPKKFLTAATNAKEDSKKRVLGSLEEELAKNPESQCHIQNVLVQALALGMHEDESTMPGKQKGTTINVKEYITELCKKYGIEAESHK